MKAESQRTSPSCGNEFFGAMEFCPVCMLRKGLAGGIASGESSFEERVGLTPDQPPKRFEHYELVTGKDGKPVELGRGAMGATYKALDINLRCHVTMKGVQQFAFCNCILPHQLTKCMTQTISDQATGLVTELLGAMAGLSRLVSSNQKELNMQHVVHNCATIRVADRTDVSGRAAAGLINDGSRAKTQSSLCRICGSAIFGCVVSVAVLAPLAPMPAQAQVGTSGTVLMLLE